MGRSLSIVALAAALTFAGNTRAEDGGDADDLAKKLANPVASLISVPLQLNYDRGIGPADDGSEWRLNIQPVAPFSLTENWNLITRTIVPLVDRNDIPVDGMGESGLGDILASQFFSPKQPTSRGWIWGVGPAWLIPSATDDSLGSEKFAVGPTGVGLRQVGPWTFGVLANHLHSVAGDEDRKDVESTFVQPFVSYLTATHTTFGLSSESTYDWEDNEWTVPLNLTVAQMLKVGKLPIQVTVGARYWAQAPDNGPEGWGGRLQLTFLFPK